MRPDESTIGIEDRFGGEGGAAVAMTSTSFARVLPAHCKESIDKGFAELLATATLSEGGREVWIAEQLFDNRANRDSLFCDSSGYGQKVY